MWATIYKYIRPRPADDDVRPPLALVCVGSVCSETTAQTRSSNPTIQHSTAPSSPATIPPQDLLFPLYNSPHILRDHPTVVTSTSSPGAAAGRAASSDSTRSMYSLSNHKQQQQQQLNVPTSMQQQQQRPSEFVVSPPLPPAAQAPGSPLFGAGEEKDESRLRSRSRQVGEIEGLLGVALAGLSESREGFGSNAREVQGKGEDYSALFNDLLSSNGLAHLITDAPIPAFSSSSSSSGYGLPSRSPSTVPSGPAPPTTTYDPRAAHYALDAQLGSPLNLDFEFDGDGAAFSPLSPYGAASPVFSPPFSNEASPAWGGGDDWAGSPASFAVNHNSNGSYASAGVSPALGELDLFGEYGGGEVGGGVGEYSMSRSSPTSHGFTAAPAGRQNTLVADVDGATSTGASYAAHSMLPPLPASAPALLFSPVIPAPPRAPPRLGTLTPVLSDNDDADVSPQLLPPPLPVPSSNVAVDTVKTEEDVFEPSPAPVVRRKPTTTAKDDSTDSDYVPSSSGGVKRTTRRVSTTTTRRASSPSSTSTSASPAPDASVPTGLKVALSAPITKRSYAVESRTSAKPIPKSLQKKMDAARRRGEEVDEAEYVEEATRKRKANTLSARESRAKKAQRVAELEELERRYRGEREGWEEERRELVGRIEGLERELEEERERGGKRVRRE